MPNRECTSYVLCGDHGVGDADINVSYSTSKFTLIVLKFERPTAVYTTLVRDLAPNPPHIAH